MLYSTCTFSPEENEQSVEYLLSLDDSLYLKEVPKYTGFDDGHPEWGTTGNADLVKCARLWPHRIKGEGHFVALIGKKDMEDVGGISEYCFKPYKLDAYTAEFLSHISANAGIDFARIEENKGKLYFIPYGTPNVRGLRLLRQGLYLGEIKKNRFEPSQSLAMYLSMSDYDNSISLPCKDGRVIKYLKGETIEIEDCNVQNGYVLVCVDGYPLGWAKNNNGLLKNKYLSGWRMMV